MQTQTVSSSFSSFLTKVGGISENLTVMPRTQSKTKSSSKSSPVQCLQCALLQEHKNTSVIAKTNSLKCKIGVNYGFNLQLVAVIIKPLIKLFCLSSFAVGCTKSTDCQNMIYTHLVIIHYFLLHRHN